MRGAVFPIQTMSSCETAKKQFGSAKMQVLAFEDVFGGKICAALDRQHPRDLFDIKILYDNEGLTDDLFRVFMVYLASARRPMHEILSPNAPVSEVLFNEQFVGMMLYNISMETLDEHEYDSRQIFGSD